MKSKYKYLMSAALSGFFGLLVAFSASAQHRGGGGGGGFHGGGGGGFHGGGGGGFHGGGGGGFRSGGFSGGRTAVSRGSAGVRTNGAGGFHGNVRANIGGGRYNVGARAGAAYRGGAYRGAYGRGAYNRGFYGRGGYNRFGRYGFYNRFYYPRLGFRIGVLPYGYYPFWWGDYEYFYSDGYYYQYDNNDYTVVEPPVGAVLNQLPSDAKSIMIDGQQYYELNGVYYQAVTKDDGTTGYQIAGKDGELNTGAGDAGAGAAGDNGQVQAPQVGDVVNVLPPNCNTVKIDGHKYSVSPDGYYYQEDRDSNNHKIYKVVGTPTDEPSN